MRVSPNYSIRFDETDKENLLELSQLLRLRRADTIRFLVQKELNTLKAQSPAGTRHPAQSLTTANL